MSFQVLSVYGGSLKGFNVYTLGGIFLVVHVVDNLAPFAGFDVLQGLYKFLGFLQETFVQLVVDAHLGLARGDEL